ncbi:hypothetical protein J6590_083125 [Homalodisca vitripennis]|nr:hypothetical protein J6590_083125 [Homalodisca vitripennis]
MVAICGCSEVAAVSKNFLAVLLANSSRVLDCKELRIVSLRTNQGCLVMERRALFWIVSRVLRLDSATCGPPSCESIHNNRLDNSIENCDLNAHRQSRVVYLRLLSLLIFLLHSISASGKVHGFECNCNVSGVPMGEQFGSVLEIVKVQILPVTMVILSISTPPFILLKSSHRPVAYEDGQSKAQKWWGTQSSRRLTQ